MIMNKKSPNIKRGVLMKKYNVAVVGAMGAVGNQVIRILEQRKFPVNRLILLDAPVNRGKEIIYNGDRLKVEVAEKGAFINADLAFFVAGGDASQELVPKAVSEDTIVVDNSSMYRMDPKVPLVIPEVNPEDLDWHKGIIANPNCSTIQMLVALKPIHDAFRIKRIVVSTYQSVSGTGKPGIDELNQQTQDFVAGKERSHQVYPHQISFNVLPHIDVFQENGYTKEEMKMVNETKKILDESIEVSATAVRVPVFRSHSESINIETEKAFEMNEIVELIRQAPGVVLQDDPLNNLYPLAIDAEGKDDVFVGRIRRDFTIKNGVNMWVVSDNLRKGAALNAVQIAETLIKRQLV
jgi:aspartate-semialdehyde dehydrogenase